MGDAVQGRRRPPGVAAVVGRVAAQQESQVRFAYVAVDGRGHAVQRVDRQQGARMPHREGGHRRPRRGRPEDEVRRCRIPDPAAVAQERRHFALGVATECRADAGQRVLRIVADLEHSAVGVVVPETGVESAQADHVLEAAARTGEDPGKDVGQGQHAGAGLDHHPVDLDNPGFPARVIGGLDHSHGHPAGGQGQGGRQPADAGTDHQDLGAGLNQHEISCAARLPASARRDRRRRPGGAAGQGGRIRAAGRRGCCGRGAHR